MKKTTSLLIAMFLLLSINLFGQSNTGTLKVFSETQGVVVFVDEEQQASYQNITLPAGSHYVKVMKDGVKLYGQIVTINKEQVTTVLIENVAPTNPPAATATPQAAATPEPVSPQAVETPQAPSTPKVGTLNIFSEFTGTSIYLDEAKQGDDIKTINGIPAGNHYLKVIKDGVSIFADLITITDGQTTTVLVKNTNQVQQKMLQSKAAEIQEYKSKKLDIIMSQNYVTQTTGTTKSMYFPGYYVATGTSVNNTVSTSTAYTDWKIIQGGNKEISDMAFANLVGDENAKTRYAKAWKAYNDQVNTGAIMFLAGLVPTGVIFADLLVDKPFLHEPGTTASGFEVAVFTVALVDCLLGYAISMGAKEPTGHYTSVDNASRQAYEYNQALKKKLGLPETFEP